ncbi:MAG: hypothetical protein MUE69_08625 [Myxococcota bacterium]|nr:hypothetical protein [Myxococcota bacterium]
MTSALGWLALTLFLSVPLARRVRRVVAALAVGFALTHGTLALACAGPHLLDHAPSRHGALASVLAVTLLVARRDGPVARWLLLAAMLVLIGLHVIA